MGTGWLSGGDLSERRAPPCWPHSGTAAGTVPRSFRPSSSMVLRGGAVEEADVEDRKYQEREAMWQKNLKEWEWILEEEGRTLHQHEPYLEPDVETQGWNHDGLDPGPEVWKHPDKDARRRGFTIDPWTAPIKLVMEEVMRMAKEADDERDRINHEGPTLLPEQLPPNPWGDRYLYWDRDEGTRPWPNFRKELPPGYYQLRFAGSCMILSPDHTFVHTDDTENHDPRTWGQEAEDRGEWSVDGATYEESTVVVRLTFHDEERTQISLSRNQQYELAGQKTFYTGEVPHLDGDLGEVQPNIFEGNLCENEECEDCNQIREADEKSDDLEEDEGQEEEPEKDR
eukprot:CAMPEP_0177737262 /NCGR_PEP_ID=MMETSP0484_2-20121128/25791_1 /TAXON_ID=354590 /ORGANISM="Rhodomonas lens, Strain RHODO" /LENGTH=340 /DNA_ID=CAMNT_0019251031 /DNA_START=150 /DNA_END=1169 /DNA_ORIENTATION=-